MRRSLFTWSYFPISGTHVTDTNTYTNTDYDCDVRVTYSMVWRVTVILLRTRAQRNAFDHVGRKYLVAQLITCLLASVLASVPALLPVLALLSLHRDLSPCIIHRHPSIHHHPSPESIQRHASESITGHESTNVHAHALIGVERLIHSIVTHSHAIQISILYPVGM